MIKNAEWLFFDIGSTLIDEHLAYEARIRKIAEAANTKSELLQISPSEPSSV